MLLLMSQPPIDPRAPLFWELSYATTRMFAETSDRPPIPAVLQLLAQKLQWDLTIWWNVDSMDLVLVCCEVYHGHDVRLPKFETVSRARRFGHGEGLPGMCWKEREVVWRVELSKEQNFPRAVVAEMEGIHTGVAFPITSGRRVLGVIECFNRTPRPIDPALIQFFHALGGQIGVFFERSVDQQERGAADEVRMLAEASPEAVFTIDEQSTILFANSAVERVFGYAPADLLGQKLTMLMPDYLRAVHEAALQRYVDTGKRHVDWGGVALPGLHKQGQEIALEIAFGEFWRGGQRVFTGFCRLRQRPLAAASS
jgi:PAS domain S-box-containing protein